MKQIYSTLLRCLIGDDMIEATLQEVEQEYPELFNHLAELAKPDGSNQEEMIDYSLHVVDAYLKLKQSELFQNENMHKVFKSLKPVIDSYKFKGVPNYILRLDIALWITILAIMCGLRDVKTIASYSNYANQYLQLSLPYMLHPAYRVNAANIRTVMRLVNYDMLEGFFSSFFTRAKVKAGLLPESALANIESHALSPLSMSINLLTANVQPEQIPSFIPCLGLERGMLLGPRQLLFACADQLSINGFDYLLSLNHLPKDKIELLEKRLAYTSKAKILIDSIDNYWDVLDECLMDMQTIVCIKRLNPQDNSKVESFFFVSELPPTDDSLYLVQKANQECETALKQPGSYLITISQDENSENELYLPNREDYNRFAVNILSYERELSARMSGQSAVKPWDVILYGNGNNPFNALTSIFYYFMSDVMSFDKIIMTQRRRMFNLLGENPSGAIPRS